MFLTTRDLSHLPGPTDPSRPLCGVDRTIRSVRSVPTRTLCGVCEAHVRYLAGLVVLAGREAVEGEET